MRTNVSLSPLLGYPTDEGDVGNQQRIARHFSRAAMQAFGPNRLIWGSNWPVSNLGGGFSEQIRLAEAYLAEFGHGQRAEPARLPAARRRTLFAVAQAVRAGAPPQAGQGADRGGIAADARARQPDAAVVPPDGVPRRAGDGGGAGRQPRTLGLRPQGGGAGRPDRHRVGLRAARVPGRCRAPAHARIAPRGRGRCSTSSRAN